MPASRLSCLSRGRPRTDDSRRATSASAARRSSSPSSVANASWAVWSSTPLDRSSCARARRARPRVWCRDRTKPTANAVSSTSPTSWNRSSTRRARSSEAPRSASLSSSWARLRGAIVSCRSTMSRATDSGSASGVLSAAPPGTGASGPVLLPRRREVDRPVVDDVIGSVPQPRCRSEVDLDLGDLLDGGVDPRPDAELLLDLLLQLVGQVGVVTQEGPRVLLALAELIAVVGVPGAGLADEAVLDAHVDQAALPGDALPVEDVELGLLERRSHLVLDDLAAGPVADRLAAVLERLDPAHVHPDRRVELQRLATGRGLGRAEHDADLLAELVDEDRRGLGRVERTGDLAQRLRHQPGLQTHVAVTHLALDLGTRDQGGHGVDDDDVERTGADQHVGDLERLLTGVGLRDQQRVGVDAQLLRVLGVERVLGVDEGGDAAGALGVGHGVQRDGGLAGGLRAVDLHDAAPWQPTDAEGHVQGHRAGGNDLDRRAHVVPEAHDRALAELLVDLRQGGVERLVAVCGSWHGPHLEIAVGPADRVSVVVEATLGDTTDSGRRRPRTCGPCDFAPNLWTTVAEQMFDGEDRDPACRPSVTASRRGRLPGP